MSTVPVKDLHRATVGQLSLDCREWQRGAINSVELWRRLGIIMSAEEVAETYRCLYRDMSRPSVEALLSRVLKMS